MPLLNSVMLIDDDKMFNFINREVIEFVTYSKRVKTYVNPDEALSELREISTYNPIDFPETIFLDISMPEMDGWEFLEEFKKLPKYAVEHCKVILLTSSVDPDDIKKSKTYDVVYDFISKPLTHDKLALLKEKLFGFN